MRHRGPMAAVAAMLLLAACTGAGPSDPSTSGPDESVTVDPGDGTESSSDPAASSDPPEQGGDDGSDEGDPEDVESVVDWPYYADLTELLDAADVVIEGEIIGQRVELVDVAGMDPDDPDYDDPELNPQAGLDPEDVETAIGQVVYTLHDVTVRHVYSSQPAAGETIQVRTYGGEYAGVRHAEYGAQPLEIGATYLFVLVHAEDGAYYPVTTPQGIYVRDGDVYVPLNDSSGFDISVADLEERLAGG